MVSLYELRMEGARSARRLAAVCLSEAKDADGDLRLYLISEHDRHVARAEDWEMRASWVAPKNQQETAA